MEQFLTVGIIVKPQGIRGEVKVKPFTDAAEDFKKFKDVLINGAKYRILSVRTGGGAAYLGLRGVADRNAAELLRGKEISIARSEAPEPEEGSYYIADLLGCGVYSEAGELLGTLTDVRQAACDIYTIEADGKEILFPAAKGVITLVDVKERKITVNAARFYEVAVL